MRKTAHTLSGIILGSACALHYPILPTAPMIGLGILWGINSPDWLEIARYQHPVGRVSFIEHRTFTHWLPAWIALGGYLAYYGYNHIHQWWWTLPFGFVLGGIIHLLTDLPNPTGIPILTPFKKSRVSLHWWKSGSYGDWITLGVCLGVFYYSWSKYGLMVLTIIKDQLNVK